MIAGGVMVVKCAPACKSLLAIILCSQDESPACGPGGYMPELVEGVSLKTTSEDVHCTDSKSIPCKCNKAVNESQVRNIAERDSQRFQSQTENIAIDRLPSTKQPAEKMNIEKE